MLSSCHRDVFYSLNNELRSEEYRCRLKSCGERWSERKAQYPPVLLELSAEEYRATGSEKVTKTVCVSESATSLQQAGTTLPPSPVTALVA